jgi:hypothetical protein
MPRPSAKTRSARVLAAIVLAVAGCGRGASERVSGADVPEAGTDGGPILPTTVSNAARIILVGSGARRGRIDGFERLRYAGFEQTTLVQTKGHLVLITMEAVNEPGLGPVQCSCSSYELRADGPPRAVASLKRLTSNYFGERTCNHPVAAADENGSIVWLYASDAGSNNPNTYAGVIDYKCEKLAQEQVVNVSREANDGAPHIAYLGDGNFVAGYYSDGGPITTGFPAPGGDYAIAMGLSLRSNPHALERRWIAPVITPMGIGRATVAAVDASHALLCGAKGPNRPTEDVECVLIDATNGAVVGRNVVYKGAGSADAGPSRVFYNQPTLVKLGDNRFALMVIESNGAGKLTGRKAATTARLSLLERVGDSIVKIGEIIGAAPYPTHPSICVGPYGERGTTAVGVIATAPTDGLPAISMVPYEPSSKLFSYDAAADLWTVAEYGDAARLANLYGRNPGRQGRDFVRCVGDVANPGYHAANGFMPDVKTFFATAVHARVPGDYKNSLFLSLVPGQLDKRAQPADPIAIP